MANRYPYPHSQVRPGMATSNPAGFAGVNMWQQQPTAQTLSHPHQLQLVEEQRQRDYLKQQQKLRLMAATSNKPVNADKLIENLLETKDMFKPRTNQQPVSSSVVPNAQIPAHHAVPVPVPRLSTGGSRPLNYSQAYPSLATLRSSVPASSGSEVGGGLPKRMSQDNSGIGFQLPVWLSSQSPSLPSLYRHIWSLVGLDRGLVDTSKIFPLLLTSGLPTDVLGYIWGLANQKIAGQLTEDELYIVLALVGLAQSGCTFNNLSILNLIPQAPVPNLNLSSFQPLQRTELLNPSLGKTSAEDRTPRVTGLGESHVSASHPTTIPAEEAADDFSDFQSAVCSKEPDVPHEPKPGAESQADPVSIQDSPLHIKDTAASTPSVAFQGISSSSEGHKFQSIFTLGSSSRGIGSRLANHSLGAPKQSKSRHHKHHHHHHHHHHHNRTLTSPSQLTQLPSPENSDSIGQHVMPPASLEEDEFSDFQQAKDPIPQAQNPQATDLFPKCVSKSPPNKPRILKESAIRSEKTESNIFFESPVHMKINPPTSEKETCTTLDPRISVRIPAIESKTTIIPNPHPAQPATTSRELLSVEEDKYSALRALSVADQEPTDSKEVVADDFGDFLSAEPVSAEDSFAVLAARDVSPKAGDTNSFWPSSGVQSHSAEFQLDDWGTFESTPEVKISSNSDSKTLLNSIPAEPSVSCLASALEGLDLKSSGLDFSWETLSKEVSKPSDKDTGRLEVNTASPAPSTSASENWMDSADECSQNQSSYKENEQHADNGSFVIKTEDDEFGEFIGPEAWPDDGKFAAKETAFEGQAVLRIKDSTCDTQSVSSLELPVLSRHGSLPSLDLKIFPSGSDKSGLLQSWDCSPQGIDLQIKEWCRCLQSCLQLLQAALATFTSIPNESVVDEVVTAHEGKEYLLNLLEVYGICRRVKQSSAGITSDSKLDSILAEVDIVWTSMELYFTKAELKVLDMDFGCNAADSSQELSACGICLTSVGSEIIQDNHNNIYPLEYGGQVYHAACANLWVNCVDCRLPALATTSSLL